MLREFQLQCDSKWFEADVTAGYVQHRPVTDVGSNDFVHARDVGLVKAFEHDLHSAAIRVT